MDNFSKSQIEEDDAQDNQINHNNPFDQNSKSDGRSDHSHSDDSSFMEDVNEQVEQQERRIAELLNSRDLDEEEQSADQQFIKNFGYLLSTPSDQVIEDKLLNDNIETILKKNVEDEIYFQNEDLQYCLVKCSELETLTNEYYTKKLKVQNEKLNKVSFKFDLSEKVRNKIKLLEQKQKDQIQAIQNLQVWLNKAIQQNQGLFKVPGKEIVYAAKSLNLFPHNNRFRIMIVRITESDIFDKLVIAFIIIGSICQVLQDFSDPSGKTQKNKILFQIMEITTYFFIIEASIKIIAQGLIQHKNAYLKNNWNLVDFGVVISSIIEITVTIVYGNDVPSFKMMRALRVFRPLRTFKRVPSMRRLVSIMLRSIPDLGNTIAFMIFFFIVFGIIGIQTFNGKIYQRCRLTEKPVDGKWMIDPWQSHFICSDSYDNTLCRKGTYCGSPLEYPNELNAYIDNPWEDPVIEYNTNNFNNLGTTIILIFEALTLEGWSDQVKKLVDSGQNILAPCFFLIIIAFGSYFMINLILAVIMASFSKFESREVEMLMKQAENKELVDGSTKKLNPIQDAVEETQNVDLQNYHKQVIIEKMKRNFNFKPIVNPKIDHHLSPLSDMMNVNFDLSDSKQELNQSKSSSMKTSRNKKSILQDSQYWRERNQDCNAVQQDKPLEESDNEIQQRINIQPQQQDHMIAQQSKSKPNPIHINTTDFEIHKKNEQSKQSARKVAEMLNKKKLKKFKSTRAKFIDQLEKQDKVQHDKQLENQKKLIKQKKEQMLQKVQNNLKEQFKSQLASKIGIGLLKSGTLTNQLQNQQKQLNQNNSAIKRKSTIMPESNPLGLGILNKVIQNPVRKSQGDAQGDEIFISPNSQIPNVRLTPTRILQQEDSVEQGLINRAQKEQIILSKNQIMGIELEDKLQMNDKLSFQLPPIPLEISDEDLYAKEYDDNDQFSNINHFEGGQQQDDQIRLSLQIPKQQRGVKSMKSPQNRWEKSNHHHHHSCYVKQHSRTVKRKSPKSIKSPKKLQELEERDDDPFELKRDSMSCKQRVETQITDCLVIMSIKYSKTSFRQFFFSICSNIYFSILILICITINTVSLSMDRYPIEYELYHNLEIINNVCTFIFVAEMFIKIFGHGLRGYLLDSMNQFDALIVIISLIELGLSHGESDQHDDMSLTIFRGFRLLRVFRLARNWSSFHKMMVKIGQTLKDIINFFILLLIVVFVFALLGTELFVNYVRFSAENEIVPLDDPNGLPPVQNFDKFENSFVSVFVCLIGEDWIMIMHDYMRAYQSRLIPSLYFIILMIIGHLFLMNLFLAILLKNFEQTSSDDDDEDENTLLNSQKIINYVYEQPFFRKLTAKFKTLKQRLSRTQEVEIKKLGQSEVKQPQSKMNQLSIDQGVYNKDNDNGTPQVEQNENFCKEMSPSKERKFASVLINPPDDLGMQNGQDLRESQIMSQLTKDRQTRDQQAVKEGAALVTKEFIKIITRSAQQTTKEKKLYEEWLKQQLIGRSLNIFSSENCFRRILSRIVTNYVFEMSIFTTVICSAICMMLEEPLSDPNSQLNQILQHINLGITIIFSLELIMKVIVYGLLINGPNSYLQNGWNILDSIIVLVSIISLILEDIFEDNPDYSHTAKNLELMKMLRVLRSIRLISRSEGLKLSVISLIHSLPGILRVTIVSILFYLLFGIFFLNMFKGRFFYCDYNYIFLDEVNRKQYKEDIITKYDCINFGGTWRNNEFNFDSIMNSASALFIMSTNEGWVSFMNTAVDSTNIGMEPKRGNNPHVQYIFIAYMIFGSLFITNLFIYVVINTYKQQKSKIDNNFMLTSFQKEWIQVQLKIYQVMPQTKVLTQNPIRQLCLTVSQDERFDKFIMLAILVNAAALSMVWNNIPSMITKISDEVQYFSNIIFIAEAAIKIIAQNKFYFKDGWNIFDFSVVCMGVLSMSLDGQPWLAKLTIFRILRVCRVLRLLKKAKRLYNIFQSFVHSIPAFMNVGSLILVLIFIFSCLGNRLFAKVMIHGSIDPYQINFMTFQQSFFTLLTVMTGEGWHEIMSDLRKQKDINYDCMENPSYQDYVAAGNMTIGCGNDFSTVFFILYVFWCSLILVNLFIAVTLQGYYDVQREDSCRITDQHIEKFIKVWADIDPDGTGYIHISEAGSLMRVLIEKKCELFPPKSRDLVFDTQLLQDLIEHLNLKLYKNFQFYNFHDILISLSQMYITYLSSKQKQLDMILEEYHQVNNKFQDEKAVELDDVIEKIDEIQKNQNVAMCKELDKAYLKFKNNVFNQIGRYEGNEYTSQMIPIVIKVQQLFRQRRNRRLQKEQQKAAQEGHNSQIITESSDSEEGAVDFIVKKQKNQIKLKKNLDRMLNNVRNSYDRDCQNAMHIFNSQKSLMPLPEEMTPAEPRDSKRNDRRSTIKSSPDKTKKMNLQIIYMNYYKTLRANEVKNAIKLYHKVQIMADSNETYKNLFDQYVQAEKESYFSDSSKNHLKVKTPRLCTIQPNDINALTNMRQFEYFSPQFKSGNLSSRTLDLTLPKVKRKTQDNQNEELKIKENQIGEDQSSDSSESDVKIFNKLQKLQKQKLSRKQTLKVLQNTKLSIDQIAPLKSHRVKSLLAKSMMLHNQLSSSNKKSSKISTKNRSKNQ